MPRRGKINGMRVYLLTLALVSVFVNPAHGQDERFFRQIFSGELTRGVKKAEEEPKYVFSGAVYRFDLDGDGKEEGLQVVKRDLIDYLDILAPDGRTLFKAEILPNGVDAKIDRIRIVDISPKTRVLVVQYDEGKTQGKKFEASARLWLISFENKDLSTLKLTRSAPYWYEFEKIREQYGRRIYSLSVVDVDGDGVKEVMVSFNHMQHIYRYLGNGSWSAL